MVDATMSGNYVTVTINATDQDGGNIIDGHLHFQVNDVALDIENKVLIAISAVDAYAVGGLSQNVTVQLWAMDNPGISTNWKWMVSGEVGNNAMPARHITVNYANGATQDLSDLLAAGTLVGQSS
jgi:hypothetical protein